MADVQVEDDTYRANIPNSKKLLTCFKFLFFIFCLTGFSYQASVFLKFYFSYPTLIELKTETPDTIVAPAITYCRVNKVIKNKFCEMLPDHCMNLDEDQESCRRFPEYCKEGMKVPFWNDTKIKTKIYSQDLKNSGPEMKYFFYDRPWNISLKEHTGPYYYPAWWSLNMFTCYTLHSRADSNEDAIEVQLNISKSITDTTARNFVTRMGFSLHNLQNVDPNTTLGITIAIHSPFKAALPQMKNLLKPNKKYDIEMKIEKDRLLPAPYKTDCIDYSELWEKNNRSGPRSKMMCSEGCEARRDLACFGCINIWNLHPMSTKKCITGVNSDALNQCNETVMTEYKECESNCKVECSNTKYSFSITEKNDDPWDFRGYVKDLIEIDLYIDPTVLILEHRPQYQDVELFSNLGGYIGIWLGISLFALIDIIRSVIVIMTPRILRFQQRHRASTKDLSQAKANKKPE